jgi:hypothetical protein
LRMGNKGSAQEQNRQAIEKSNSRHEASL